MFQAIAFSSYLFEPKYFTGAIARAVEICLNPKNLKRAQPLIPKFPISIWNVLKLEWMCLGGGAIYEPVGVSGWTTKI